MTQPQKSNAVSGMSQSKSVLGINGIGSQSRFRFEPEMDLAAAITTHLGRDLFAGVTDVAERKARARIALVIDKLEGVMHGGQSLGAIFEAIYSEPVRLPGVAPDRPPERPRRPRKEPA